MTDYFLAVGSTDDTLRTLEGPTFDVATTRFASGGGVNAVAFSPDGAYLAVGVSAPPWLVIIRTSDWSVTTDIQVPSYVYGVSWSPDGAYLAVGYYGGDRLTVFDTSDWSVVPGTPSLPDKRVWDCAWSPDGAYLAVVGDWGEPNFAVIDTTDWSVVPGTPSLPGDGYGCEFSPDGAYLALGLRSAPYLVVLNAPDWTWVSGVPAAARECWDVSWSPDGAHLAVGHHGSDRLTVIDTSDWSVVPGTPAVSNTGRGVAWSSDGAYLAVAHDGAPYLTILDATDWSTLPGVAAGGNYGRAVAWLPDINRPTRHGILYDHDGNPLSLPVQLLRRPAWTRSQVVTPDPVSGAFTVRGFAPGDYHLLIPDTRPGATDDRLLRITLDETTGALAPLAVHMPYAGALATINGNATKAIDGSGADDVIVRAWGSHGHVIDVVPAPSGDWSAEVPPGTYDITYRSAGCQPVCHGPYTIAAPEEQG
ncbi:WD40 repeat domain-containing protein [Marichromatium gracile]|uniref:WD40 repeat domain-containing protein n=1 Tax=Marichromatium gracile TaxID=1048 RepID=UPI001F23E9DF|nr:WD40 repeat domain-containing protein [Marichromatium gracile]MCF1184033.1 WD40 repeat domain-containing protein [Marichromatium gracile]